MAADFLVAATGAAVGAVMVGPAAGPLEQPPSANNANISPTASARTDASLLILITIVRIIGFMMLDPPLQRATVDDDITEMGPWR